MRRKVIPELLDEDLGTPTEISSCLADLRSINERFGGTSTTAHLLQRVAAQCACRELSLLEVASGSGDVPMAAKRQLDQAPDSFLIVDDERADRRGGHGMTNFKNCRIARSDG